MHVEPNWPDAAHAEHCVALPEHAAQLALHASHMLSVLLANVPAGQLPAVTHEVPDKYVLPELCNNVTHVRRE